MSFFAAERLKEIEVGNLAGAGFGEKALVRLVQRTRYRTLETLALLSGNPSTIRWQPRDHDRFRMRPDSAGTRPSSTTSKVTISHQTTHFCKMHD